MIKKLFLLSLSLLVISCIIYRELIFRIYNGYHAKQASIARSHLYRLNDGIAYQDITDLLIKDKSAPRNLVEPLIKGERRIIIFKYLSDSNTVAGYMSYLTDGEHPTIIFLRGGNGFLGIMRPNNPYSFLKGYNVIGTLYRGNIYGGEDELGGHDIHDVENLIKFFPNLEQVTHTKLNAPFSMIGVSRGAMQMFLSLSYSDFVKSKVNTAISISGDTDMRTSLAERSEMKYLFKSKMVNSTEKNLDEWIAKRNPVDNVGGIPKSTRVLLIYGLSDKLVSLQMQQNFKQALDKSGIASTLVTIPNANHGFENHFPELENRIISFLRENSQRAKFVKS